MRRCRRKEPLKHLRNGAVVLDDDDRKPRLHEGR
jgi:hypothetical protein